MRTASAARRGESAGYRSGPAPSEDAAGAAGGPAPLAPVLAVGLCTLAGLVLTGLALAICAW